MPASPASSAPVRERLSFDSSWRFHLGDIPMPVIKGHGPSYESAKAGKAWGAAAPDFDDSSWRRLDLPHDWVVEGPFDPEANISQGYRPRGVAWYRRHFRIEESDRGRHLELQFDGIATHATIWVNGLVLQRTFCGYAPFQIDITAVATYGDQINTIAIRVDAEPQQGWWYEGGGIYRHAWLVKRSPVHIETHGLYAQPVRLPDGSWHVPVQVSLHNIRTSPASASITVELLTPAGLVLASARAASTVPVLGTDTVSLPLAVPAAPALWSLENPLRHTVRCHVHENQHLLDSTEIRCGFRTIRFDPDHGFFLNDQPLKLQGTCNHQDHAGVGVAVPDALWDFRIRRLRELGCNAYRCAHNPPAEEFLDACDRLGLLVMDENRNFNCSTECLAQLRAMVRRDRNHPSVILWSVFNEEPMQGTPQGREMVRRMVAEVRRWDTVRPVTAAMNGGMTNPEGVFEAIDVMGFNYNDNLYDEFHARFPRLPCSSAEDTSAFQTRGEFETDPARNVIASYDDERADWGKTHREAWRLVATRPFLAGGFVWTGFDYRGEPQRLSWPSVSSVFGIMDTCGFPKTAYHIHQANWIKDRPVLALAPHWNWPGRENQPVRVLVMTNGDSAELFLNGASLGRQDRPAHDYLQWQVPYAPGRLEAVSYQAGREHARTSVETTGQPAAITLTPDRASLAADGRDAMPVTVSVTDSAGRIVPRSENEITFTVRGPGRALAHGNGNHNSHEPEQGPSRRVFHGLAQLIVQAAATPGHLVVRAESPGLTPAELVIEILPADSVPSLPAADPVFAVNQWRVTPHSPDPLDPHVLMSEADMNSWMTVNVGNLQNTPAGRWVLYRATFQPWHSLAGRGGLLRFAALRGRAQIWIDGQLVADKPDHASAPLQLPLPARPGRREVTLLVQAGPDQLSGLEGPVTALEA